MQIRTDDDIFNKYGCSSRPLSPTALSAPLEKMTTTGNELGETDNQTIGSQPEREPHPQHPLQQPQTSTLPLPFPPELIDHIVDHLHDDKQSLMQCSKTSRLFSHSTSYHLFRTVGVPSVRRCVQFQELIRSALHPLSPTSTCPYSPSSSPAPSTLSTSTRPPPPSRTTCYQTAQTYPRSHHLHPSRVAHAHTSTCDVSAVGWDISKFVRKVEFHRMDPQSPVEEYISEAVKLVGMLPRIREVVFGWWMQADGLERIGRAFAATSLNALSGRIGQRYTGDPLKLCLELVDFDSVPAFLDLLGSFGGRLRELSLTSVTFGDGGNGKGDIEGRCFPGLECVSLGYDAVVQPKGFGEGGQTMENALFGMPAFGQEYEVCEVLENIAPNVNEMQLFADDIPEACIGGYMTLRLPRFRRLNSVTVHVPGPRWSDLIYEIAAWFASDRKLPGEIAEPACQEGVASPSPSADPSLPSATRANRWENRKKTRVRFAYPVGKDDIDWRKLESAVLGEGFEGLDGGFDCPRFGNRGEDGGGGGNDADDMVMRINRGKRQAAGSCGKRTGSLWVEVGNGSAALGEVRRELVRLDELGLLQVSCR